MPTPSAASIAASASIPPRCRGCRTGHPGWRCCFLGHRPPVCSLVAPSQPGAALRKPKLGQARDNARPAATEWGTRGPHVAAAWGPGAKPRLRNPRQCAPRGHGVGLSGPPRNGHVGFGAKPRLI